MNEEYDFDSYLNEIMSAVYGEEVRGSMRSALEILYGMLQDAESGVIDIRDQAEQWANTASDYADTAYEYAAQAMSTTPEGYDLFALAIADVIGDIPITQLEVDGLFLDPVVEEIEETDDPNSGSSNEGSSDGIIIEDSAGGGTSSEDPINGQQIEGEGEP